jgi:hypothetical protein
MPSVAAQFGMVEPCPRFHVAYAIVTCPTKVANPIELRRERALVRLGVRLVFAIVGSIWSLVRLVVRFHIAERLAVIVDAA